DFQLAQVDSFLEDRDAAKPLALWVSFMEPHSPFYFPLGERKHQAEDFNPPSAGKYDGPQIPLIFRDLSRQEKQGITAAYYNSVSYLDQSIGALITMLKRRGLYDNTYIVYMADHVYCL